jgi:hypothetical protein
MLRSLRTVLVASPIAWCGACSTHVLVGTGHDVAPEIRDASVSPQDADTRSPDASTVVCGASVCGKVKLGTSLSTEPPCCYTPDSCGVRLPGLCAQIDAPGRTDPACSSFGQYQGCCKPDDTCGITATGTVFGCVNPLFLFPAASLGSCSYGDR